MSIDIEAAGLVGLERFFEAAPAIAEKAQRLAINQVAERGGMKLLRQDMLADIAFPAGYLDARRLSLKKAYSGHMEAVITARQRPTSLARFVRGGAPGLRKQGLSVTVKPGKTKRMPKAFLMRLRAGATITDTSFNIGLAIRLKPGERIMNKTKQDAVQLSHNLYLLYAPSVDQVFRHVAADDAPKIGDMVGAEFFRQYDRLSSEL